jgi:hypothetical protein
LLRRCFRQSSSHQPLLLLPLLFLRSTIDATYFYAQGNRCNRLSRGGTIFAANSSLDANHVKKNKKTKKRNEKGRKTRVEAAKSFTNVLIDRTVCV